MSRLQVISSCGFTAPPGCSAPPFCGGRGDFEKPLPDEQPRPVQARLERGDRDLEHLGHVGRLHLLDVHHPDRVAVGVGQLGR